MSAADPSLLTFADFAVAAYALQSWEPRGDKLNDGFPQGVILLNKLRAQGWTTVVELDLPPPSLNTAQSFQTGYKNGFYANENAAAMVAKSDDTLFVSFRGTNDNRGDLPFTTPDTISWNPVTGLTGHYGLFQPFISALDNYVRDNGIKKVYVTGHSLGAAMVHAFMHDHPDGNGIEYRAVTFASPGYYLFDQDEPFRITNFLTDSDAIDVADWVLATPGDDNVFDDELFAPISSHSVALYRELIKFLAAQGVSDTWILDEKNGSTPDFDSIVVHVEILDPDLSLFAIGSGDNALSGTDANELILGGAGRDSLQGLAGHDLLLGGVGNDRIYGGDGDDILIGGAGDDTLDGGAGFDTASFDGATSGVRVELAAGRATGSIDTLASIESVLGSQFADRLDATGFGTSGANVGSGGSSFNQFEGGGGNDTLIGNGETRISFQNASRRDGLSTGDGIFVDLSIGVSYAIDAQGPAVGTDTISHVTSVRGSIFDDQLLGSDRWEIFEGRAGNDRISGRGGQDIARYDVSPTQAGIVVLMAAGQVTGDEQIGTDSLNGIEVIRGTKFSDTYNAAGMTASSPNATGGSFNEFEGLGGNDTIIGNNSTRINYARALDRIHVDLLQGFAEGLYPDDVAGIGTDTISGIQQVRGSNFADILRGSDKPITDFSTFGGAEVFFGGAGNDIIDGRGGVDMADYRDFSGGSQGISVTASANGLSVVGPGAIGTDTLTGIEYIQGTIGNDIFNLEGFSGGSLDFPFSNGGTYILVLPAGGADYIHGGGHTALGYQFEFGNVNVLLEVTNSSPQAYFADKLFHGTASVYNAPIDTFDNITELIGTPYDDTFRRLGHGGHVNGEGGVDLVSFENVDYLDIDRGITVVLKDGTVEIPHNIDQHGVRHFIGDTNGDGSIGDGDEYEYFIDNNTFLSSVERVWGTYANDALDARFFSSTADFGAKNLGSYGHFNELGGGGGDDTIWGNSNTRVSYFDAPGSVYVDLANGYATGDGKDKFMGGVNAVWGSQYDDLIIGTDNPGSPVEPFINIETFIGVGGNDTIDGAGGFDRADYSELPLFDVPLAEQRGIVVTGSSDQFVATGPASIGIDTLLNIESIVGTRFADTYNASGGEFMGGGGNDIINSGGSTRVSYRSAAAGVTVMLGANGSGSATGDTNSVGRDTFKKGVIGVRGSLHSDTMTSNAAGSLLEGLDGNDTLIGGAVSNTLDGGEGDDTYIVGSALNVIVEAAEGGIDTIRASIGYSLDLAPNVENLVMTGVTAINIKGSDLANAITGNSAANVIDGGIGNDTLSGEGGNDTLVGGAGDDTVLGGIGNDLIIGGDGAGDDVYDGGSGIDTVKFTGATKDVKVDLSAGIADGEEIGHDLLAGIENVTGGSGNDTLTGDGFANILLGNGGNDVLSGGEGNDTLTGGDGNDVIDGGLGNDKLTADGGTVAGAGASDTVSYASILTDVTVNLALTTLQNTKGAGKDTLLGFENLTGGAGNDVLTGNAKANIIDGGAGNDVLTGAAGNDTLTGGDGNDLFKFLNAGGGNDTILDFDSAFDLIGIVKSGFGIGAVSTAAFSTQDYVVSAAGHTPTAAHAQFLFDETTRELWFDSNGTLAGGTQSHIATLINVSSLAADDFDLK